MKTISTILFATFLIVGTANAYPIQWTAGDGHWYDVVLLDPLLEWEQAREFAHESGGYLASLTSAEENEFVWHFLNSNLVGDSQYKQYWRAGEPNNDFYGTQDYLHFWATATGEWDDMENGRYMAGYVLEYEQYAFRDDTVPVPTPEPSTMLLLGSGLIALSGFGRKLTRS